MLSSVLKSHGAVSVNIQIMRIFVKVRQSIVLVDNYVDENVLTLLSKRNSLVKTEIE